MICRESTPVGKGPEYSRRARFADSTLVAPRTPPRPLSMLHELQRRTPFALYAYDRTTYGVRMALLGLSWGVRVSCWCCSVELNVELNVYQLWQLVAHGHVRRRLFSALSAHAALGSPSALSAQVNGGGDGRGRRQGGGNDVFIRIGCRDRPSVHRV